MFVLTCRLVGKSVRKPRKPIPYNLWGKDNRGAIKHAYASAPKDKQKQHDIGTETTLKQALFEKQPESIQKKYRKLAQKSHKEMLKEWNFNLERPASTDPESRQVCIDGITSFMQPILDLVVEFTGMRVTFMMGGPEPAAQGRMNIIALHSGLTKGPVKVNFGQAESEAFQSKVVPVFSDFLRKCFTREDAQAAALPIKSVPMLSILDPTEVTYCEASGMNFNDLKLGDPKGSGSSSAAKDTQDKRASKQSSAKSSKKPSAKSSNESKKSSKKPPATSKQSKRKGKKATSESDDESQSEDEDEDEDDDQKEQPNPSSRRNSSAKSSNTASKKTVASSAKSSNTSSRKTVASKRKGRRATSESDDESQSEEEDQDADGATDESDDEEHLNPSRGRKLSAKSSTTPSKKLVASKQPKGKGKGKGKAKAKANAKGKGKAKAVTSDSDEESQSEDEDEGEDADGATDVSDGQEEQEPSFSKPRKSSASSLNTSSKKPVASKQPKRKGGVSPDSDDDSSSGDDVDGGKPPAKSSKTLSSKPTRFSRKEQQRKGEKVSTSNDDESKSEDPVNSAEGSAGEVGGKVDEERTERNPQPESSPHLSSITPASSLPSSGSGLTSSTPAPVHTSPIRSSPPPHSVPPSPIQSIAGSPASPILSFDTTSSGSAKESSRSANQESASAPVGGDRFGPPRRNKAVRSGGGGAGDSTSAPAASNSQSVGPPHGKSKSGSEKENPGGGMKRKAAEAGGVSTKRHKAADGNENGHGEKRKSSEAMEVPPPKRHKALDGKSPSDIPAASSTSATNSSGEPSTSSTGASMPTLPPDCNPAIKLTLELAKQGRWGSNWDGVIVAWLEFEASHQFNSIGRLGTTHRPPSISHWIQRARSSSYRPQFEVKEFDSSFWKWWITLQPSWRKIKARTTSRDISGDWGSLDKPGSNGLASVVAALYFWGLNLGERRRHASSWAAAVDDVTWVFNQLATASR